VSIIKPLIFFILLVTSHNSLAQKENNQWRFGFGGALDFNTLPPNFVAGCPISTFEGSASVADRLTGALLFYTNGVTVWNANNQIMPNGTGLLGGAGLSSTTAAVIVPKPGSSNLFFIVTVDQVNFFSGVSNGVNYSVVDMTLNGGLGDIVAGQKNIFLYPSGYEKLEVVPAFDGLSLWLIACSSNNEFISFKIDDTGIQATPVISAVFQSTSTGHMKINRQFNKLAIGGNFNSSVALYDFNNQTGIVSNPITWIANLPSLLCYGIEFSPDGKVLYIGDLNVLLQFDLTQTTPQAIQNSEYQVASGLNASLQLGIDEKIYVNSGSLSTINFPNTLGVACNYQTNVIANQTGVNQSAIGLPKWVYYANDTVLLTSNSIAYSDSCFGNATQFSIQNTTGISIISWNFDDPVSGINNTAVGFTPNHTFSAVGTYKVCLTYQEPGFPIDTICKTISIVKCDPIEGDYQLFIPNVITPNGDGANDVFFIKNLEYYPGSRLFIFNRWGQELYSSMDYRNDWGGGNLSAGNYYYHLFVHKQTNVTQYQGMLKIIK
jgi:gliding motility-associated-like protein